jgi:hypothetical protein
MAKKQCTKCKRKLPLNKFSKRKYKTRLGYQSWCKKCKTKYTLEARKKSKTYKQYQKSIYWQRREWNLKKKFGITLKDYDNLLKSQDYSCYICGKLQSEINKHLDVDHNHKTGKIRGLLCAYCNRMLLRYLRDNKLHAIGLIKYLTKAIKEDKDWEV